MINTIMRIQELHEGDLFGVDTMSPNEIAKKHSVSLSQIINQLKKGISVELEHTNDRKLSREIALDHLTELPDYYDRLEKMERS